MILTLLCQPSSAEVFKCIGKNGAVSYQPSPCQAAIKQQQLEIKSDPVKDAEAKAKLEQVRSEYEIRKSAQQEADKLAAEQRNQAATIEAARRGAIAQQEMAEAQRRQAEAMENQYNGNNRPIMIPPQGMPGTGFNPGFNSGYNPP
jgi:regulator of protease activity HflC (stomatin/prohibitin superfamily)